MDHGPHAGADVKGPKFRVDGSQSGSELRFYHVSVYLYVYTSIYIYV